MKKLNLFKKKPVIDSRYTEKTIPGSRYMTVPISENFKTIEGIDYVLCPYIPITTHVIISDKNGTRRYRQVSRWYLFKSWFRSLFKKSKKL